MVPNKPSQPQGNARQVDAKVSSVPANVAAAMEKLNISEAPIKPKGAAPAAPRAIISPPKAVAVVNGSKVEDQ